ncbi:MULTISPECIES: hypothetical protein [Bacillales]|uniref:Uncharacterized protein n=2 Tax=Bacillus sonorensis TaxID=119858 RepID=M5NWK5_9BACI|nr:MULTISPECIES: hypothetical protein [Bacillales]QMV48989.1 hypothetical protein Goe12_c00620 [Bacillus phage vB_BsuS-Goe12]QMV49165.1 hypothetical protein Goe13_c00640 [Bacillus phage vB_BsuS-Goe13]UOX38146.1 hypothetical protein [Bacillus phage BUCT083]WIT27100.1 hypothetical protein [Bacillus phage SPbetaL2]ASB89348.1 hypothetical protein S101395_02841 [Bacillus sonorensis]
MKENDMTKENRNLVILEAEREQAKMRLENEISSIRNMLDNLESKLKNNQQLYISDGLQGNGSNIDKHLAQLATYDRAIELFNRQFSKDE